MTPILVRNIKHLTDARYFAAMGVDWMSIELTTDPASFMLWHALRSWVEGVMLAAEMDINDEMLLAKTIIDAKPDGIILKDASFIDLPDELNLFWEANSTEKVTADRKGKTILLYNDMISMEVVLEIPADRIFLEARWSVEMLNDILLKGYAGGICFSGGDEDMTGVRDYGVMDDMIALLAR
ncbi:MAG: hypothetical protein ABJB16_15805 [Saprospiraceae bacterium]